MLKYLTSELLVVVTGCDPIYCPFWSHGLLPQVTSFSLFLSLTKYTFCPLQSKTLEHRTSTCDKGLVTRASFKPWLLPLFLDCMITVSARWESFSSCFELFQNQRRKSTIYCLWSGSTNESEKLSLLWCLWTWLLLLHQDETAVISPLVFPLSGGVFK